MAKKVITERWEANDGQKFDSELEADIYNAYLEKVEAVETWLQTLGEEATDLAKVRHRNSVLSFLRWQAGNELQDAQLPKEYPSTDHPDAT